MKSKYIYILVRDDKSDFIQGELLLWGFCNMGEKLGSTLNTTRKMGISSQGAGEVCVGGSLDGKLPRGNIKG